MNKIEKGEENSLKSEGATVTLTVKKINFEWGSFLEF